MVMMSFCYITITKIPGASRQSIDVRKYTIQAVTSQLITPTQKKVEGSTRCYKRFDIDSEPIIKEFVQNLTEENALTERRDKLPSMYLNISCLQTQTDVCGMLYVTKAR